MEVAIFLFNISNILLKKDALVSTPQNNARKRSFLIFQFVCPVNTQVQLISPLEFRNKDKLSYYYSFIRTVESNNLEKVLVHIKIV